MKKRMCFGILMALLFLLCLPLHPTLAKDANVKDCFEGKGDCSQLGGKVPSEKGKPEKNSDETGNQQAKKDVDSISPGTSLVKMFLALIVILVLIYGTLKFLSSRTRSFQQNRTMQNLGGISVGQNKSVQLVRIGNKLYMIGVGDNVELLQEIEDEDVRQEMLREVNDSISGGASEMFSNLFAKSPTSSKNKLKINFITELDRLKANRNKLIRKREEEEERHE
ncbi:flagellar biosynthetic protein FliO [Aciduricibacillus chroicocephali]|uniref:Flagellar biosynthetic protein FliO n=1 Tax=Aciduricibacillus chroicocephali TaxID=3054939 RepID=A0ABY9L1U5_9BACI|nr:flagellar biosynthetic protein FliO [Bacillaceae bacterium 44XB]